MRTSHREVYIPYRRALAECDRIDGIKLISLLLAVVLLGACAGTSTKESGQQHGAVATEPLPPAENVLPADQATVVAYPEEQFSDPWIGFNRAMFAFNDVSYRYVMIPVADAYNHTPEGFRDGISRFFTNLKSPRSIINHLLQGEPKRAGVSLLRFLTNSTLGLLGIFDPAQGWFNLEPDTTGFNDTLRQYGVGQGPYLVLPFLGPADVRSGSSVLLDYTVNPVRYLTDQPETTAINATDAEQEFSRQAERYTILRAKTDDPYLFFRNMYLQNQLRDAQYKTVSNYSDASQRVKERERAAGDTGRKGD